MIPKNLSQFKMEPHPTHLFVSAGTTYDSDTENAIFKRSKGTEQKPEWKEQEYKGRSSLKCL